MKIGIPKEVKIKEFRVGATPANVKSLIRANHDVIVQTKAGDAIGFTDEMYMKAGAKIVSTAKDVYRADMIVKVKEPQESEFALMHEGQILFCYLHLAPDPKQTKNLLDQKVVAIAYETVTDKFGRLPLLTPMSEVAGRISVQAGATALQMANGGRGVLLGGIAGVKHGKVMIIGGGVVGTERSVTGESWTQFTQDIAGWTKGDLCQLYGFGTGTNPPGLKMFHLCSSDGLGSMATQDEV